MELNWTIAQRLGAGELDDALGGVYGEGGIGRAKARCLEVLNDFKKHFGAEAEAIFRTSGRTELGGNHTDHQQGCVLAAGVDLDMLAAAAPNRSGMIRVLSKGYPLMVVDLGELEVRPEEVNTSYALIRGVAARFAALGCSLAGLGVDMLIHSQVLEGSGLSSSSAYEVLLATVLNGLFFENRFTPVELGQIAQYAETVYFGKPCGLMDQTVCAVGGAVSIDFERPDAPVVEKIPLDLAAAGYALCILDSGAGHADLTAEYAAIPEEMRAVAECFGVPVLRQLPQKRLLADLRRVRREAGDRAVLRALHFYGENRRAVEEAEALKDGDFERFLALVRRSGDSSARYLQNITPGGQSVHQEVMVTIALCEHLLGDRGAVRVHGGGFGGTVQAFVPLDQVEVFCAGMEGYLGAGACHVLSIPPKGSVRLA